MIGKLKDLTMNLDGTQNVTVTIGEDFREQFDKLKSGEVKIEIKKYSPGRSLDANAYMWKMCSEIGKAMYPPLSKEEVYRDAIRAVGSFSQLKVANKAVKQFQRNWSEGGLGWFVDVIDKDKDDPESMIVHAYFGSSTYTRLEMKSLIDYIVQDAESLGICTITNKEADRLLELWGKKKNET